MNRNAPLLLVFERIAEDVSNDLQVFVELSDEVSIIGHKISNTSQGTLLISGLVFSVRFLDPATFPAEPKHVFCDNSSTKIASVMELNLGENIKGGETIAPIIKALLVLSLRIGNACNATAVYWRPAHIMTGFDYFSETVALYEKDGIFPVLPLVDIERTDEGNLVSHGLSFLSTQELRLVSGGFDISDLTRRMVRVVHDVATNGPIANEITVTGIDPEETLILSPNPSGLEVAIRSSFDLDRKVDASI